MNPARPAGAEALTPVKRALIEIRELRLRLKSAESAAREPIAIVGAGLRMPGGVNDLASLWELLSTGRDAITAIPSSRWDVEALYDEDPEAPGRMITRHGGFLGEVDRFDAEFFGISPREAETLDPQQRITLETAWHAIEDAGIAPTGLSGTATGFFMGVCNSDYARMIFAHPERIDPYFSIGTASSVLTGRLSYFLGLRGPSVSVDTACSSSLVALHLAIQSLRSRESDLALAGGVNLILSPELNITFSKAGMMARDGRCKTFDASADGYVRGEGCGILVLKRLRDCGPADRVRAVLRGSAINQDGRSSGLTAPNGPAQEAVIRAALDSAGIAPRQIGYVETHGTGTPLGDPIEVQALAAVLAQGREPARPVALGSIKTNVGHLEAAAGVAGVLKVMVAMEHGQIPPHLHLATPSPHIDWARHRVVVPTELTAWEPIEGRRLAGVSSFGFGGANAHVIVEAAPAPLVIETPTDRPQHVLALSARDPRALLQLASSFARRLGEREGLADVAFTANAGRAHFRHRLSVRGASAAETAAGLEAAVQGAQARGLVQGEGAGRPRIAFLFTGWGAQSVGMARGLYRRSPVFRAVFDEAAAILEPMMGRPLLELIDAPDEVDAPIHETRYGQPALVAVEVALAGLWRSWGIVPAAVLGHSLGEYAAAHVAGILSLEDALRMVVERARAVDALGPGGGMTTIFAAAEEVQAWLSRAASAATIAAYNGPEQVGVSGPQDAVDVAAAHFEGRGVRVSRLRVAYASHSAMMEPALGPFARAIEGVRFHEPQVTFVSNLTGAPEGLELVGCTSYWCDHLRQPVRFAQSVRTLPGHGITHYLEIGPHPVLVGMGASCLGGEGVWLPSLRRNEDDWDVILDSLQQFYAAGAEIDWRAFDAPYSRRVVSVPRYPFQRKRHWADWARAPAGGRDADHGWRAVVAALALQSGRGPIGVDLEGYEAKWACLERLTVAHAALLLRGAGIFTRAGERATVDEVRARLGAPETYRPLLQRWLDHLRKAGQLRAEGDWFESETALPEADLEAHWAEAEQLLESTQPLLAYLRHCGSLLGAVLSGAQSPLETLFPGGDFAIADGLYRRSSMMRYINELAAAAVGALAGARGAGTIRVLEVGAGTGGTTAALLPQLPGERTRYRFTDVSSFFFARARAEFAAYPFVEFAELDLDRDLEIQGVEQGSVDLVVAANSVHASRDLRAALERLHRALAPGGMLLLVESTAHLAWFDMTTGLIEGWRHFADDLRTDHPLLAPEAWVRALREAGFEDAIASPCPGSPAAALGQHVVVARVAGAEGPVADFTPRATDAPQPPVGGSDAVAERAEARRMRIFDSLPGERLDLLREFVRDGVTRVLRLDAGEAIGRSERLMDLGFDSLMAVRLRNLLGEGLALHPQLPVTLLFDYPTIDSLAACLLARLDPSDTSAVATKAPASRAGVLGAAAVAAMSDAEIEALLLMRQGEP